METKQTYTLVITAKTQNINFEAELKEYNDSMQSRFSVQLPYPEKDFVVKHLEVTVSEEQFAAIKKSALEVF